jgi:hypothetical protein
MRSLCSEEERRGRLPGRVEGSELELFLLVADMETEDVPAGVWTIVLIDIDVVGVVVGLVVVRVIVEDVECEKDLDILFVSRLEARGSRWRNQPTTQCMMRTIVETILVIQARDPSLKYKSQSRILTPTTIILHHLPNVTDRPTDSRPRVTFVINPSILA